MAGHKAACRCMSRRSVLRRSCPWLDHRELVASTIHRNPADPDSNEQRRGHSPDRGARLHLGEEPGIGNGVKGRVPARQRRFGSLPPPGALCRDPSRARSSRPEPHDAVIGPEGFGRDRVEHAGGSTNWESPVELLPQAGGSAAGVSPRHGPRSRRAHDLDAPAFARRERRPATARRRRSPARSPPGGAGAWAGRCLRGGSGWSAH